MDILLTELAVATLMVLMTVILHGLGLLALGVLLQRYGRSLQSRSANPASLKGAGVAGALALGLMTLHGLEIWAYGLVFLLIDAVPNLRDAVYYSTISYATIGYSDTPVRTEWRLLGAIEGVNGTLLMGWSVAFFVTVMTRFFPNIRPHRRKPSSPP